MIAVRESGDCIPDLRLAQRVLALAIALLGSRVRCVCSTMKLKVELAYPNKGVFDLKTERERSRRLA